MAIPDLMPHPVAAKYAVLVDVGYLYAAAGEVLLGAKERKEYRVAADELIQASRNMLGTYIPANCCGSIGMTPPVTACPPSISGSSPSFPGSRYGLATSTPVASRRVWTRRSGVTWRPWPGTTR